MSKALFIHITEELFIKPKKNSRRREKVREKQRAIKSEVTGWQMVTNKSNIRKRQKRALSKKIRKEMEEEGKE